MGSRGLLSSTASFRGRRAACRRRGPGPPARPARGGLLAQALPLDSSSDGGAGASGGAPPGPICTLRAPPAAFLARSRYSSWCMPAKATKSGATSRIERRPRAARRRRAGAGPAKGAPGQAASSAARRSSAPATRGAVGERRRTGGGAGAVAGGSAPREAARRRGAGAGAFGATPGRAARGGHGFPPRAAPPGPRARRTAAGAASGPSSGAPTRG